jgi:hypothetical protein
MTTIQLLVWLFAYALSVALVHLANKEPQR